jgi:hypothetical protein
MKKKNVKASPCIEAHLSKKFKGMLPLHCAIKVERTGTVKAYTPKGELRPHLALKYSSASDIMKLWNHYPEAASIVDISTRIYPYQLKGKSRKKTMSTDCASESLLSFFFYASALAIWPTPFFRMQQHK